MKTQPEKTSLNQVPALHKQVDFLYASPIVLDLGGGKYDKGVNYLLENTSAKEAFVFDPYARSKRHNLSMLQLYKERCHVLVCANVMNVIDSKSRIIAMIHNAVEHFINPKGVSELFFSVYEGDKSGVGHVTKINTYQRNEKLSAYVDLVKTAINMSSFRVHEMKVTSKIIKLTICKS